MEANISNSVLDGLIDWSKSEIDPYPTEEYEILHAKTIFDNNTKALLELKQLRAELAAAKKTIEARDNECRDEHYTALCECTAQLAREQQSVNELSLHSQDLIAKLVRLKEENTSLSDSLKAWIGNATRFKNNEMVVREELSAAIETLVNLKMIKDPPWRPIDLAPRDGTVILGYDGFRYFIMAFFEDKSGDFWAYGACGEITCNPKFWLPLPNPPGATAILADDELSRLRLERDELRERGEALAVALKVAWDFRCEWHDCRRWTNSVRDDFCYLHKAIFNALNHWRNAKPTEGKG